MTNRGFAELIFLEDLIQQLQDLATVEVLGHVTYQHLCFPLYCISLGSKQADVPVLAYFGGVHGLEKIGTEVICAYLQTVIGLLQWDVEFQARLQKTRLVFFPLVNPVGVYQGSRSNGNGVDLMRNSPVRCVGKRNICSGHRITPHFPWYQGLPDQMEIESEALCTIVRRCFSQSTLTIALDLHSGFGIQDRIWFPYAYCQTPYPGLAETLALKQLLDGSYPHHFYKIEPMSKEYVIEGDLWDYLYLEFQQQCDVTKQVFVPLTLEMGSWSWLKKNPQHVFRRHGLFHPVLPHRRQRILRRHLILFDFLHRCLLNPTSWAYQTAEQKQSNFQQAKQLWYD